MNIIRNPINTAVIAKPEFSETSPAGGGTGVAVGAGIAVGTAVGAGTGVFAGCAIAAAVAPAGPATFTVRSTKLVLAGAADWTTSVSLAFTKWIPTFVVPGANPADKPAIFPVKTILVPVGNTVPEVTFCEKLGLEPDAMSAPTKTSISDIVVKSDFRYTATLILSPSPVQFQPVPAAMAFEFSKADVSDSAPVEFPALAIPVLTRNARKSAAKVYTIFVGMRYLVRTIRDYLR